MAFDIHNVSEWLLMIHDVAWFSFSSKNTCWFIYLHLVSRARSEQQDPVCSQHLSLGQKPHGLEQEHLSLQGQPWLGKTQGTDMIVLYSLEFREDILRPLWVAVMWRNLLSFWRLCKLAELGAFPTSGVRNGLRCSIQHAPSPFIPGTNWLKYKHGDFNLSDVDIEPASAKLEHGYAPAAPASGSNGPSKNLAREISWRQALAASL